MSKEEVDIDELIENALEERADNLSIDNIRNETASADFFSKIYGALVSRGTKLIEGPRGCGKTHMMRYAWITCLESNDAPLPIYVTFNRYYRLEPLLQRKADAIGSFTLWVLLRMLQGVMDSVSKWGDLNSRPNIETQTLTGLRDDLLQSIVPGLERGFSLTPEEQQLTKFISPQHVVDVILEAVRYCGRKRAVLFLDDAALTLTPDYMHEFFDIVRAIKHEKVSPKASVYPGTTEYGPNFHVNHEAEIVPVWLAPDDPSYHDVLEAIGSKRFHGIAEIPSETAAILRYASFGVPRAYLTMLREFRKSQSGTPQSRLNKVIESHKQSRISEYESLKLKMPKFSSLIEAGSKVLGSITKDLTEENKRLDSGKTKQLVVGIAEASVATQMAARMLRILVEAGLLYEHERISHGHDRTYKRYTPHLALLISNKAFLGGSRGQSNARTLAFLSRRPEKHPLRRSLASILTEAEHRNLKLDLPDCRNCGSPRITDSQKFCHSCGAELIDISTFTSCMEIPLRDVPGLTVWQKEKVRSLDSIDTIGDLLSTQDPGTELRKIHRVGKKRAQKIITLVSVFVDEFLS